MSDLISRKWLMECIDEGWIKFDTEKDTNTYIHLVRDIAPSAHPDLITKMQNGIKVTDAEDVYSCGMRNGMRWCISLIDDKEPLYENCPSAQPERKKGRWYAIGNTGLASCECGYITDRHSIYKFCPICGAEMTKGENDETD